MNVNLPNLPLVVTVTFASKRERDHWIELLVQSGAKVQWCIEASSAQEALCKDLVDPLTSQ